VREDIHGPASLLFVIVIELYFDYTCPFAYLASMQVRARRIDVVWRPVLLGGIFKAQGTAQNLSEVLGPAKSAHNLDDMQRWARHHGNIPLRMPPKHPLRSVEALRATLATGIDPEVIAGFYRAYWVENVPISDRDVIRRVVSAAGHDADKALAAIETAAVKDDLKTRTDEAIARGVFGVPTWIVGGELYWGQDRLHFVLAAEQKKTLDVYWDFSSPFAYLASTQIAGLAARTGVKPAWHPVLLGGLFRSIGTTDVPLLSFPAPKQRHYMRDIERWAAHWRVPYRFPSRFPMRTVDALRTYLALPGDRRDAFRDAVMRAYWAEDRDIADRAVLGACIGDEAIARDVLARIDSDEVKAELRRSTDAAVARGVFGVPTFVVDGKDLYWGQDRLGLVEESLAT